MVGMSGIKNPTTGTKATNSLDRSIIRKAISISILASSTMPRIPIFTNRLSHTQSTTMPRTMMHHCNTKFFSPRAITRITSFM